MNPKRLGRYDLLRVLGEGAMGVVYEGRDPNLDRRVAIKTVKVANLSPDAAAEYEMRFRTEARSAARLQHPHIVSVYDSARDGDVAYLVMEYVQGKDLKAHLDSGVRYSLEQSLRMIRDLLAGLDYAHRQGIVHRDVKPANLLIEAGGGVKLTDFGVARIQDSGELTRTQGGMIGTLKYMSPEQVQGQRIDSRTDLFSVGVVLYQLLTDRRPFDGDNDFAIIHQIIGHHPEPPSSINARLPAAIDAVVARALAKDRDQRFATARDFAVALQSAMRRAADATVVPPADLAKRPAGQSRSARGHTGSGASSAFGAGAAVTSGRVTTASSATSPSGATVTQELELVYWKDIKDSSDPEELEDFLKQFPVGVYADLARRRLKKLTSGNVIDQTATALTAPSGSRPAPSAGDDTTQLIVRDESVPASAPKLGAPTQVAGVQAPVTTNKPIHAAVAATALAAAQPPPAPSQPAVGQAASKVAQLPGTPEKKPHPKAGAREKSRDQAEGKPALAAPSGRRNFVMVGAASLAAVAVGLVFMFKQPSGERQRQLAASTAASQPVAAASSGAAPSPPATTSAAVAASAALATSMPTGVSITTLASAAKPSQTAPLAAAPASRAASGPPRLARVASAASLPATSGLSTPMPVPAAAPPPTRTVEPRAATIAPSAAPPIAVQRSNNPEEMCADRMLLSKQFCLEEACGKPGVRDHPVCAKRREDARLREAARNQQ